MGSIVVKPKTENKDEVEKQQVEAVTVSNTESVVETAPQIDEKPEDVKDTLEEEKEISENTKASKNTETNDIKKKGIMHWFKKMSFRGEKQNINKDETKNIDSCENDIKSEEKLEENVEELATRDEPSVEEKSVEKIENVEEATIKEDLDNDKEKN